MAEVELVPFLGLILYCLTYVAVLAILVFSLSDTLTIEEDEKGQRRVRKRVSVSLTVADIASLSLRTLWNSQKNQFLSYSIFSFLFPCLVSNMKCSSHFPRQRSFSLSTARIVWIDLRAFESKNGVTFGLNRIAFCTFFTAFTLVVFHW